MSEITCPHCGEKCSVEHLARIPDEQRIRVEITSEGRYVAADVVGGMITGVTKLLGDVANNLGAMVCVFLSQCVVEDGRVSIELAIVAVEQRGVQGDG